MRKIATKNSEVEESQSLLKYRKKDNKKRKKMKISGTSVKSLQGIIVKKSNKL